MTGRILCLGDSLTYGFGLPRGLVWTALCAAQTGAELLGGGVNGNTMGAMAHLIIAGGGLPLIGIPPGLRRPIRREWAELMPERAAELLAEYQSWLRRFAAAFRLPVLDFDRAFTRWGEEGLFQPDGLHPNAAGHCLMAETAAALIRSL